VAPPATLNCKGGGPSAQRVTITDVSNPGGPRIAGSFAAGPSIIDFAVSEGRYFELSKYCRESSHWEVLNITDVSDPKDPVPLLRGYDGYRFDAFPLAIEVTGNTAFVATENGLDLVDVTDPSSPIEVGSIDRPWVASDLVIEGDFAYVTAPESGLWIIDVSDPAQPVEVSSWVATWKAHDLEVADGFAFVADGDGGLRVIDVTNPADPTEVGVLETEGDALNVAVSGSLATVGLAHPWLIIVDVSDPANPTRERLFVTEGPAVDVALTGSTAFAVIGSSGPSDVGGFQVLGLSIPESPTELSSFEFRSSAMDISVSNAVKYIANGDSGLYVLDESNPDEAVEGFLDTPGFALGVTLHDHFALVADDHKGIRIIDVSDPGDLVEVGFVDTPGQARRVAVAGEHAYVADGDGGLRIVDISLPASPVEIAAIDTQDPAMDVAIAGNYAYVAARYLQIFDVYDPAHPVAVDTSEHIFVRTIAIEDQLLYLVGHHFRIFDITNAPELQLLPETMYWSHLGSQAMEITLSGHHAYVATRRDDHERRAGVVVFDILNPYFPSRVGWWDFEGDGWGVEVSNGRVYLAGGEAGIVILDNRCLTTYWVEIATHTSGFHGSQWRSDVIISHEAERRVAFDFILHTVEGEFTAGASVETGHQGIFNDIVGMLGYEGNGALEIQASHPLTITSRIYSETDPGTYGAFLQGYRSSDCFGSGKLHGLRQVEGEFRTNINVTNTTPEAREVWITLYRTDGSELSRYSVVVEPHMVVQDLQPFKNRAGQPNLGWGFATVYGEEGILACASVIDSRTNDALIVPLVR